MRWVGRRSRTFLTRNGRVTVARAYYHCACGRGYAPADGACQFPPGQATWAVQDRVALVGAWLPFRRAAELYAHLTGHEVSAGSVENWTEAVGVAAAVPPLDRYVPGPTVDTLFIQADAVMVRFDDGWHEVKVAVCWGRVNGEDLAPRYLTAQGHWEELVDQLGDLARRQGLRRAQRVICLADGAPAIWKLLIRLFPAAQLLLDWYHLHEHLATVARLLPAGRDWHERQKAALAERGPTETVAALTTLTKPGTGSRKVVREAAQQCLGYLASNSDRLDYPSARRQGYPIGSGRVESACRFVVQQRCKQAGMCWDHRHAQAVLQVRCAHLNGEWDQAIQRYITTQLAVAA